MTSAAAWSVALVGMDGQMVEVEAAIGGGLPRTIMVGLPDTALYEARDRCRAAVTSAGLSWPAQLVTINLTPAALPKSGSHYDLAITASVLAAGGLVPPDLLASTAMFGELGLDGRTRVARGILPAALAARDHGFVRMIVAAQQVREARLVEGLTIWGVRDLGDLVEVLHGRPVDAESEGDPEPATPRPHLKDLADVAGQATARWALEVAAAGRHHLYLHGAPGVGKTMLAERLPGILPDLTPREAIEVSAIHSLAGIDLSDGLLTRPPYSDPHHNVSMAALVGGGPRMARPGAISLAHRGVLFLDEAPEFGPRLLEALRTPLERGSVTIGRADRHTTFPARFQLVLAANPCPCGRAGTPGLVCECPPMAVRRYRERLSGPILDRIDIQVSMAPVRARYLVNAAPAESSAVVGERVRLARERQARRLRDTPWTTNAEVPGASLRSTLPRPEGIDLLDTALVRGQISSRGADKCLRVAWTLADIAGRDRPARDDVQAALMLRRGEGASAA
ncbi:MAG TPA: YifB family Mg chelatase-like AAA ATPase [Propionibacteriaceae bacterium]|nr:YifB family Mg chelatase-like AAA ATPase [Propionibacteriaceae bacterium]